MSEQQQNHIVTRALVVAAHPDDIEFGLAGTVANWTDAGIQVTYCLVTDGAAGTNDPNVTRDEIIARRQQEQIDAAAIVGVKDVRFLGYPDGVLEPTLELRRQLTRLIRELRPERVVISDPTVVLIQTPEFDYINHPDHRAAAEATLYAVFPSAETRPIFPELLAEGLEPHHVSELWLNFSNNPNVKVDISANIERKLESLRCHKSQLDDATVEMVRGWSAEGAKDSGYAYAEDFRVMRFWPDEADRRAIRGNDS